MNTNNFFNNIRSKKSLVVLGCLFIFLFFTLPYLFPTSEAIMSVSYSYGFNNKIGIVLVALSIFLFFLLGLMDHENDTVQIFALESPRLKYIHYVSGSLIVLVFVIVIGLVCGEQLIGHGNECSYFLPNILDMKLGYEPYKDFMFFYGPLMIYVPFWLNLMIPLLSVLWTYLFSLAIFHLFGVYAIFDITNGLKVNLRTKKWIFWLVFIACFPFALGMNYQLSRFVLPFWFIYRIQYLSIHNKFWLLPISSLICIAISPEVGLVYFLVLLLYCFLEFCCTYKKTFLLLGITTILVFSIFIYVFSPIFSFLLSFTSGLNNFPFFVSYHLIIFFSSVFVIGYLLGVKARRWQLNITEICFIIMSLGLIPACLGRCDPGHVIYYGLFILIVSAIYILQKHYISAKIIKVLVIFLLLVLSSFYIKTLPTIYLKAMAKNNIGFVIDKRDKIENALSNVGVSEQKVEKIFLKIDSTYNANKTKVHLSIVPKTQKVAMPLVLNLDDYIDLQNEGKLIYLYYPRLNMCGDKKDIQHFIGQMNDIQPRYVLLPVEWEKITEPAKDNSFVTRWLFCTYYPMQPGRNGNIVFLPFVEYIKKNYQLKNENDKYCLWERKDAYVE